MMSQFTRGYIFYYIFVEPTRMLLEILLVIESEYACQDLGVYMESIRTI